MNKLLTALIAAAFAAVSFTAVAAGTKLGAASAEPQAAPVAPPQHRVQQHAAKETGSHVHHTRQRNKYAARHQAAAQIKKPVPQK